MNKPLHPFVSVVIPVFNDAERLKICLEALENQIYSKSLYEVIVVDNNSSEDIKATVAQFGQASLTYESRPGSYAARNQGISLAKGDVIAFTDSDCIPALDWLENGVKNLLNVPDCGLVAGKVELFFKDPNQPTAVELYESIMAFPQQEYIEKSNFGATANVMTFKSVIDQVGLFDSSLESSGDAEWGKRIFSAGYRQTYADDTCVAHPARYSLAQLHKKLVRVVQGQHNWQKKRLAHAYQKKRIAHAYQRYKRFILGLVKDLWQPVSSINLVLSDEIPASNIQKFKIILILFFRSYCKVWIKIRIQFEG